MGVLNLFVVFFAAGIVMMFVSRYHQCPPQAIEYRYLPRTLDQQMKDAAFKDTAFTQMFDGTDVWYRSVTDQKLNKMPINNK